MSLPSYLYQPDYRNEHPEVPQPPPDEIRRVLSQNNRCHGDADENSQREANLPQWQPAFGVGVEYRQVCWPEHLPHVNDVGHKGIVNSC